MKDNLYRDLALKMKIMWFYKNQFEKEKQFETTPYNYNYLFDKKFIYI